MRFGARGPVEHDIGRRHQLHLHHPRVDRVFARIKRRHPNAFVPGVHQVAMLELQAAHVYVRLPHKRDHHAHVADRDLHHRHLFHLHKPGVQIPACRTAGSAPATRAGRRRRETPGRFGSSHARRSAGPAISPASIGRPSRVVTIPTMSGCDAMQAADPASPSRARSAVAEVITVNSASVDPVGAGRQDPELPAFLAAVRQELARVLEIVAVDDAAQDALGGNGRAVGGHDQGDFALGDDRDRHFHNPVLPRPIAEVHARGERVRLVTGLAVERDQAAGGSVRGPKRLITTPTCRSVMRTAPSAKGTMMKTTNANPAAMSPEHNYSPIWPLRGTASHRAETRRFSRRGDRDSRRTAGQRIALPDAGEVSCRARF